MDLAAWSWIPTMEQMYTRSPLLQAACQAAGGLQPYCKAVPKAATGWAHDEGGRRIIISSTSQIGTETPQYISSNDPFLDLQTVACPQLNS